MAPGSDERYLTTAEVARRLDVKPETVYAYVSRGLLTSVRAPGRRGSLFAQDQVDRLADRGAQDRQPRGAVERIRTELTLLDEDELYYRGHRVADLATANSIESVAYLLWTGELVTRTLFPAPPGLLAMARGCVAALPESARLTDQLRVVVAALGAADPLRFDLAPAAVVRAGETLLGVMVDALPEVGRPAGNTFAARLWPRLTTRRAQPALLNAALILLADHDLAVSTMAARVAASARAHPYAVVSAGLGALDGHYHGVASSHAYRFLAEAMADPVAALSERLRSGQTPPGFGHAVYRSRDPRAEVLFGMLRRILVAERVMHCVDALVAELGTSTFPNVDLGIAAMMHAFDMRQDAGEAIFAVARTAGWIAHALEEYREPGLRFRPLGVYTGDRPAR
ncbi:citrate synthase [Kutzneria viridogrisea]|uniref:citrate synthase n=1 Tax=Kutzneria TaxID=43356 RepID=UPI00046D2972|nr:citrate synthase [Kutzneria albida]